MCTRGSYERAKTTRTLRSNGPLINDHGARRGYADAPSPRRLLQARQLWPSRGYRPKLLQAIEPRLRRVNKKRQDQAQSQDQNDAENSPIGVVVASRRPPAAKVQEHRVHRGGQE